MIDTLFHKAKPGAVRVVRCPSVTETLARLEVSGGTQNDDFRFVARTWDELPPLKEIIDDVLQSLAEAALALWPGWYGQNSRTTATPSEFAVGVLTQDGRREILPPWTEAAAKRCSAGKPPIPPGFPNGTQALQLSLAIEPHKFFLSLCLTGKTPKWERLYGLGRGAEWFARETGASVLILIPEDLLEQGELDNVNFDQIRLSHSTPEGQPLPSEFPEEKSNLHIWPIHGIPHPNSAGECLLAKRLKDDPQLGVLFEFNEDVYTKHDHRYTADLLWRDGRVVVEVDGYYWHSDPFAFRHDRHRDYEMLISGYLVLRVPHDEVMADVEGTMQKIRDLVEFRRKHMGKVHPIYERK